MKRQIKKHLGYLDLGQIFEGFSIPEACSNLINSVDKNHPDYNAFKFSIEYGYETLDVAIYGMRIETEKEYQERLKEEEKILESNRLKREKKEQQEKEQYEKLKAKYENN